MTDRQAFLVKNVDDIKPMIFEAERWLWAHPQTGFTEWEANQYLTEKFEALGYTLTQAGNIPGFYTDIDTGKPGPALVIMGELDALDIANHPESVNGMTHCCGHHAQCAAMLGIAAALQPHGFDVLPLSKGDVFLSERHYGFFGGASGKIAPETLAINGSLRTHRDGERIAAFLKKHGIEPLELHSGQIADVGGILPLTEEGA